MPRIAVAGGVFVLIVFSIGFNTMRYAMVWKMVGDSPQLSQPTHPAHVSQPTTISKSETTVQSAASRDSAAVEPSPDGRAGEYSCSDSAADENWEDDPAADPEEEATRYADPHGYATQQAEEVEPSSRYLAGVDPAEEPLPSASVIRVVGISGADLRQNSAAQRNSASEVRRLPPIGQVAPFAVDRRAPSPGEPIPVYPSSGI